MTLILVHHAVVNEQLGMASLWLLPGTLDEGDSGGHPEDITGAILLVDGLVYPDHERAVTKLCEAFTGIGVHCTIIWAVDD